MQYKHIRLGIKVTDSITGLTGTLSHLNMGVDRLAIYCFRPLGIIEETGCLKQSFWIVTDRIVSGKETLSDLPLDAIRSKVTNKNSGATGIVVSLTLHVNGCIHLEFQPKGSLKNGEKLPSHDDDMRELEGPAIPKLTQKAKDKSKVSSPSPSPMAARPRS